MDPLECDCAERSAPWAIAFERSEPFPKRCPKLSFLRWLIKVFDLLNVVKVKVTTIKAKVAELLAQLTSDVTASLTGYDFILNALSVANIF